MPPELRRIWFIWILDQLSMHAAFFFIPFSDREWKTVNPDSDSKCNHPSWRKKMILDFCRLLNCSNCLLRFLWICTMIWFYSSLPKGKKNVWHVWLLESCVLMVLPSVQCFWEIIQLLAMCVLLIWRFHSCECYWPWGLLYTGSCSMWQLFLYIRLAIETRTPLPLPTLYILLMVEKARRIWGVVSARLWLASVITLDTLIMFICLTLITKVTALREM